MNDHARTTVGVDIAKAHPDAHRHPTGESAGFANDAAGIAALAKWIGPSTDHFVHESAGHGAGRRRSPWRPRCRRRGSMRSAPGTSRGPWDRRPGPTRWMPGLPPAMGAALEPRHVRLPSRAHQPESGPQAPRAARARQAAEGGPRSRHAQDAGVGQRPDKAGSAVDGRTRRRNRLRERSDRKGTPEKGGTRIGKPDMPQADSASGLSTGSRPTPPRRCMEIRQQIHP